VRGLSTEGGRAAGEAWKPGMNQDKTKEDLLPLLQRSFDLSVDLYAHVNRFPRVHKSLLGRDLLTAVQRMLIGLIAASRRREEGILRP